MVVRYAVSRLSATVRAPVVPSAALGRQQRRHQQQSPAPKATQHTCLRLSRFRALPRAICVSGRSLNSLYRLLRLSLAAHAHYPQCCYRHRQPQPFGASWVAHLGLFPMPPAAFGVLEPTFNPRTQSVPRHIGLRSRQIGQDQPRLAVATIPSVPATCRAVADFWSQNRLLRPAQRWPIRVTT